MMDRNTAPGVDYRNELPRRFREQTLPVEPKKLPGDLILTSRGTFRVSPDGRGTEPYVRPA